MELGEEGGEGCEWMEGGVGKGGDQRNKKRFSEEQIKSLESMFATQTKLEPRQKLQLARELGLQPRQVAIWFQNKRARWKSKQLEKEYAALRDDYDALLCSYDSLKKEKQLLLKQLEKLAEILQEPPRGARAKYGNAAGGAGGTDVRSNVGMKEEFDSAVAAFRPGEADNEFAHFGGEDETGLFRASQPAHAAGAFAPAADGAEHQFHFHTSWPSSDQTCSSSQWWGSFESLSE